MRVLFYVNYPLAWAPGGHSIKIREIGAGLRRMGVDVAWLQHEATEVPRGDVLQYWSRPPSDVHWQFARAHGLKIVVQEILQVPMLHGAVSRFMRSRGRGVLRRVLGPGLFATLGVGVYPACDAAIAVSEPERRYMIDVYGARPDATRVIPEGARDAFFDPEPVPVTPGEHLLCIGFICERKNSLEIARSAHEAGVKMLFVGDALQSGDPYVARFREEVDGVQVRWIPSVHAPAELRRIMREARGVVLASRNEGVPLVLLESLAARCPVLTTGLVSIRSTFGSAVHYCPPPGSPGFAAALRAFRDGPGADRPGTFRVLRWSEIATQYFACYERLLHGTGDT